MLTQLLRPRLRVHQTGDWTAFVGDDWPRNLLDADLADRVHRKQGRSIARWTVVGSDHRMVAFVKRHYTHSLWKSLWRKSDAMCEWHHLQQAAALGIPVPRAIAVAEWSHWPRQLQSAIVLEELAGMIALHEAIPLAAKLLPTPVFHRWKAGLIAELVRLTKCLHDRSYYHRDLYLCHFFVQAASVEQPIDNWRGRVVLIDFHRLARQRVFPVLARAKDLAQLLYSARLPGITLRDVLRFWRLYRGGQRQPLLRRLVEWKARRYARHNRKDAGT